MALSVSVVWDSVRKEKNITIEAEQDLTGSGTLLDMVINYIRSL